MEASARRPVLISVVAILAVVQGVFSVLAGIALIIDRNDADLRAHVGVSSGNLTALGIFLLIVGAIEFLVALGLWRGNQAARVIVAIVTALQGAGGIYELLAYSGTYLWQGIWQILFSALILYILFNQSSERFFEGR